MKRISALIALWLASYSLSTFGGAWGVGAFENDTALDWVWELERAESTQILGNAFESVHTGKYVEVDACSQALAAAEVVASMRQQKFGQLPDEVRKWAKGYSAEVNEPLRSDAVSAVSICRDQTRSELAQLWAESAGEEWSSYVSGLLERLK